MGDGAVAVGRIRGALLGVHAGDSLGATLEFLSPDETWRRFPDGLRDIVGGGPFDWASGAATDDTDLTLAVANAYRVAHHDHDELVRAVADRMLGWFEGGPADVGNATATALVAYGRDKDPATSGRADEGSQGNGSLMRTVPVGVARADADRRRLDAVAISAITHAHPVCVSACVAYCDLVDGLLRGGSPADVVTQVHESVQASGSDADRPVAAAVDLGRSLVDGGPWPPALGWVLDSLTLAVWALLADDGFERPIVRIVMHGGDTDTNAAIAGGLLGAHLGEDAIPERWREPLEHRDALLELAEDLAAIR